MRRNEGNFQLDEYQSIKSRLLMIEVAGHIVGDGVVFPGQELKASVTVTNTGKEAVEDLAWGTAQVRIPSSR